MLTGPVMQKKKAQKKRFEREENQGCFMLRLFNAIKKKSMGEVSFFTCTQMAWKTLCSQTQLGAQHSELHEARQDDVLAPFGLNLYESTVSMEPHQLGNDVSRRFISGGVTTSKSTGKCQTEAVSFLFMRVVVYEYDITALVS